MKPANVELAKFAGRKGPGNNQFRGLPELERSPTKMQLRSGTTSSCRPRPYPLQHSIIVFVGQSCPFQVGCEDVRSCLTRMDNADIVPSCAALAKGEAVRLVLDHACTKKCQQHSISNLSCSSDVAVPSPRSAFSLSAVHLLHAQLNPRNAEGSRAERTSWPLFDEQVYTNSATRNDACAVRVSARTPTVDVTVRNTRELPLERYSVLARRDTTQKGQSCGAYLFQLSHA